MVAVTAMGASGGVDGGGMVIFRVTSHGMLGTVRLIRL